MDRRVRPKTWQGNIFLNLGYRKYVFLLLIISLYVNTLLTWTFFVSFMQWDEQQDKLRMQLQNDTFGVHTSLRTLMDRELVSNVTTFKLLSCSILKFSHIILYPQNPHFPTYSRNHETDIHLDILKGTDTSIDINDVFRHSMYLLLTSCSFSVHCIFSIISSQIVLQISLQNWTFMPRWKGRWEYK